GVVVLGVAYIVAARERERMTIILAICELGSTIGAVEEVDINSLNSKEIVSWCQTFFVGMMTLLIWARGLRGDEDSGKDIKGKSPLKISSSQANDEEFNDSEDDLNVEDASKIAGGK
ncbi:hypothetical protein ACJX0J_027906, partial [Zea mays]